MGSRVRACSHVKFIGERFFFFPKAILDVHTHRRQTPTDNVRVQLEFFSKHRVFLVQIERDQPRMLRAHLHVQDMSRPSSRIFSQ